MRTARIPKDARRRRSVALLALTAIAACGVNTAPSPGPAKGSVVVVGGGALGPEIYVKFIELAGGPNALIVDVPTAGGDSTYDQNASGAQAFRRAGAKNVIVLHTIDKRISETDSFPKLLANAGGVWFEGGRQYRLMDSYGRTKTERAFHDVLARGGVVGGSSAGASILGSYMVRGAPSNDNRIMAYPGYEEGFGFLQGVGIDQHVVARERLPDLADSLVARYPKILFISEDEGTAWVVRNGVAEIIGRNKAFVYGTKETDAGKPFLTLLPGDRYDLGRRRVIHRAIEETALSQRFIDSLFAARPSQSQATILVAQDGKVFVASSYGISAQRRYMPTTTMPNFELGGLSAPLLAHLARAGSRRDMSGSLAQVAQRQLYAPAGMHKTVLDTATRQFSSNVDELYRFALLLDAVAASGDGSSVGGQTTGLARDQYHGIARESAYGTDTGRRNAFVRFPDRQATIIVLSDSDAIDARAIADRVADRLLFTNR